MLDWEPDVEGGASEVDVVSGLVRELRAAGGFTSAECLGSVPLGLGYGDFRQGPGPGNVWYYLVRARSVCGMGSFGDSTLAPDPRDYLDAEVGLSMLCP